MQETYGGVILPVNLDSLVGFSSEEATATLVKAAVKDTCLTV